MTRFTGQLRQRLRNPTVPFALLMLLVIFAIPALFLVPGISSKGIEGYRDAQRLQQREFAEAPATGSARGSSGGRES